MNIENLSEKHKDFIALGKRMKEMIALADSLSFKGHPVVNAWVNELKEAAKKHRASYLLEGIWRYNDLPQKKDLFEILTNFRRILKIEGIFSEDFVE